MPMPSGIAVVDLMLELPTDDRGSWYDFMKPLFLDAESRELYKFPAEYCSKPCHARLAHRGDHRQRPRIHQSRIDAWAHRRGVHHALHPSRVGEIEKPFFVETFVADQTKIEVWRVDYNDTRPHSTLDQRAPTEFCSALHDPNQIAPRVTPQSIPATRRRHADALEGRHVDQPTRR